MFNLPKKRMIIADTFKATFDCWKNTVISLLPLSIFAVLMMNLPFLAVTIGVLHPDGMDLNTLRVVTLFGYIVYLIPAGAMIAYLSNRIHGKTLSLKQTLQIGLLRFSKLFLTGIALFLIVGVIFFFIMLLLKLITLTGLIQSVNHAYLFSRGAALVISLLLLPYMILLFPLVVIENVWPHSAILSAYRMVTPNWVSVFSIVIVMYAIYFIFGFVAARLGSVVVHLVLNIFILPLMLTMSVIVAENLKLPK